MQLIKKLKLTYKYVSLSVQVPQRIVEYQPIIRRITVKLAGTKHKGTPTILSITMLVGVSNNAMHGKITLGKLFLQKKSY